ncbi:unnamed protein product [Schistocephalus solidus]|uniref:Calponin-homology (CH) domain-containing protein n=1 Tax=Schistocephalus solidus TaxID=70667 RepID=A0A183SH17_SCHSO|nr:unnamed protein product [Schistocephalus solidus]
MQPSLYLEIFQSFYHSEATSKKTIYDFEDTAIDPIWEKQQKKTFTAWCNLHLKKVNAEIESIENDFRNGLKLLLLLEVISDEKLPKPERGKMRVHQIANVNKALDFIKSKGVRLVSIGAEEIVDGNVKMTLGMIWTIILRFAIQDIQVGSVHRRLPQCSHGLAFCALIHRYHPDLIDLKSLKSSDPIKNLNVAFTVAEEQLGIPKMLDPEDMVSSVKPDDRSVMAYVSCYYHSFAGTLKVRLSYQIVAFCFTSPANVATSRICKALELSQMSDQLCEEYDTIFSNLTDWIKKKKVDFEKREPNSSMAEAEAMLHALRQYRAEEKPLKIEEKARLETTFRTLQTRLRLNNRPAYLPKEGMLIADVILLWKQLETCERQYEEWLVSELKRTQNLDHLIRRFNVKCTTFEAWAEGKEESLKSTDYKSGNLAEVRPMLKKLEAFESDLTAQNERIMRIEAIQLVPSLLQVNITVDEVGDDLCFSCNSPTSCRFSLLKTSFFFPPLSSIQELDDAWQMILGLARERQNTLEVEKQKQMKNDEIRRKFADHAGSLNAWLEDAQGRLNAVALGDQGSLEEQVAKLTAIEAEMTEKRPSLADLEECHQQLQHAFVFENTFSSVTIETLRTTWNQLLTDLKFTINEVQNQILTRDSKGLSASQLEDLRRCFNHFDKDKSGKLDQSEFTSLLVSIGHTIGAEDNKLMMELDPNHLGYITFDVFVDYMTRELTDMDTSDQLRQSFRTLCGDKGYLTAEDLRRELPAAQAEYCISKMKPLAGPQGDNGALNFENFVILIYGTK